MISKKDVHIHRYTTIFLSFWKVYYFNIFIFFILTVKKESPPSQRDKTTLYISASKGLF